MQRRDSVGMSRQTKSKNSHAKQFFRVRRILAAQAQQSVLRKSERLAERPDMLFDQVGVESIVSGGDGSVCGENNLAGDSRYRRVKSDAFVFHAHANRFQHRKGAVTFIQVQNAGSNAQRSQSSESAQIGRA